MVNSIEVHNLFKRYGDLIALDGLSLQVTAGSIYGFLGPNGAGKTTTIDCVTGLADYDEGEIWLLGKRFRSDDVSMKRRLGVMPEDLGLFDHLTGEEFLVFCARMYGLDRAESEKRAQDLLAALELDDSRSQRIRDYSTGMQKKLAFGAAIIPSPEILFLDEPFESVDPATVAIMKGWLKQFAESGRTVFFSSHVLEVVENFCSDVGILMAGKMVWSGATNGKLLYEQEECASIEELFLRVVGTREATVSWL